MKTNMAMTASNAGKPVQHSYKLEPAAQCIDDISAEHYGRIEALECLKAGEPLYSGQAVWNVCASAGVVERMAIRAKLLEMHERDKHRHNYWHCAVVELFGS